MKILVDTCVWSLLLRRRSKTAMSGDEQHLLQTLTEAIQDGRIVLIGPIRQEVLSGIKDQAQFEKLRTALAAFPDETLTTAHYEEAARLFNLCRSRGVECGSTDILICAVAAGMRWNILTYDQGLKRCLEVLSH
ncbi:MAG TPA: PIN domain-containing protein [Terracidiphilus sp.]|nr:PIN domain-containing protein [Terracidiphilus sp.]